MCVLRLSSRPPSQYFRFGMAVNRKLAVALVCVGALMLMRYLRQRSNSVKAVSGQTRGSNAVTARSSKDAAKPPGPRVDMLFLKRLRRVFAIAYPSIYGVETLLIVVLTFLLVSRTRLTVIMADVIGRNAKFLVQRNARQFISGVADIGLWSIPSAAVNSGIRFTTALLEGRFRRNVQVELHKRFLSDCNFVKLSSQANEGEASVATAAADGEARTPSQAPKAAKLDNPDHRMTQDLQLFCFEVADLFSTVFKPTMDVITFVSHLAVNGGVLPPAVMIGYYIVAGYVLRLIMPNFAKLTALTQQKEGDFRHIHAQIIQHAEEVAFYRGERIERDNADKYIDTLVQHQLHVKEKKSVADFMDAVLIKYGATCVGYAVCSMGVFAAKDQGSAELTRIYIRSSQLYIPLARAIGKLVMLHRRFTSLAGYTFRVGELVEALSRMSTETHAAGNATVQEIARCDVVDLQNVTIAVPGGEDLIKNLTIRVERGQHLLIRGTNGSGKTSLIRVLCGLWPAKSGTIVRPPASDFYVLSQRTFLPIGTMREQLIYPDTLDDFRRKGISDDELWQLIADMNLTSVIQREGGLDMFKDWHEVLSGGERQRVAFIRMLYFRPVFGIIDEATSAVSTETEPNMYVAAQRRGITLITVSHRTQLCDYHATLLTLDGQGGHQITKSSASAVAASNDH